MKIIVWLILVTGYGLWTWAAGKFSQAAHSFLEGGYLAFLCFLVLPQAMGDQHFFLLVSITGLGVLAAVGLEKWKHLPPLVFAMVTYCQTFWAVPLTLRENLFLAFFGGMGLYHASAGIIPDKVEIGKALLSGAGFVCGTFLFVCF
ncbi:MAG: hypothetical protein IIV62_03140 [Anaerotignum sp.]|nr:hypothetical protein [Anaerotignum sp.]